MSDKVWIFDTTLRDGEQALKASLTEDDKLQLAHTISRLNVDVMEVGFPVSSPADFRSVQRIATEVKGPIICGLARAVVKDIEACGEALRPAEQRRIHTFIATSPLHLEHKLRMSLDQATEMAVKSIKLARNYTDDVEFSCEDAGRTPHDDLCRIVERAIAAGASTINLPDTVGYVTPQEYAAMISHLMNNVPNIDKARLSVHCHNDLGLAVANSIAAVQAGARQIECTINGIGERAGNCSMEEVAMILKMRHDYLNLHTDINSEEIYRASRQVSQICNMPVQPNKAIVGENAFAHSSGIHQDGVLKAQNTYEIMSPETVGVPSNQLNMTSRSGRHVIQHRLSELGYQTGDYDMESLYESFLALADQKGTVYDYDLEAMIHFNKISDKDDYYQLDFVNSTSNSQSVASSTVGLVIGGEKVSEAATGNGPVEASYKAIKRITAMDVEVIEYNLDATGAGESSLGQVDIIAKFDGKQYHGAGLAADIVEASVRAMVRVYNLIYRAQQVSDIKQQRKAG
ncbi:2-isopropylmalate synthase [Pseudoalteromonas tunicata]|jgi:2-isopropylmalate synthase|uniref:2-isopropylmalate synthase n=1 Tax=Pseudoalteromonas tunicata D2 TaxID=87626 RepID=A4CER5_9GAMM|nr:2-isopropylmalate synthase [Pseudoalteromonas tunicata]ATC96055.1 2-isopropylmalate synthase [Pseudoalteromonas tunicata]AXT31584.1 2-isopropylmalate synthase [Pseudoalteromonas tunicata]EAR26794.1 2-isopropylmalate synthase [Pseudoalteromonas tunicata D2]MDP4982632.1 2-isopropylmalate synthase [Pseudoalteromonas tunicata]MDP5213285.1 2-isopropylmalate synthase [Pseudoalteromonas tunicata]